MMLEHLKFCFQINFEQFQNLIYFYTWIFDLLLILRLNNYSTNSFRGLFQKKFDFMSVNVLGIVYLKLTA